jgi:hypothetical protein
MQQGKEVELSLEFGWQHYYEFLIMLGGLSFGENFEVMNLMQESVA